MELILIRHTRVATSGVCYGFSDVDLADTFELEKNIIIEKNEFNNTNVFSSTLSRCTKLASSLSSVYTTDDRIKELNFGDWEMQKWDEITDPRFDAWMKDYVNYRCPNGESLIDMKNRVEEFYNELISSEYSKLVVVTHAGVIRLFHHLINGVTLDKMFDIKIDYGEVIRFKV